MSIDCTVLIPTHNHGPLLRHAIQSVLDQTIRDVEVFVIGDGADAPTCAAARDAARRDTRVRFFERPKVSARSEVHRHAALQEARGWMVCYLSDDDLWLPAHLEAMAALLREADFAHAVPLMIHPDESVSLFSGHLGHPVARQRMEGRWNFIPLGNAGHTLDLYRRLPHGWRTSPEGTWNDLYMWRQILGLEGVRAVSGQRTTVLHFPSPERAHMSLDEREAELARWSARLREPDLERELTSRALDLAIRARFEAEIGVDFLQGELAVARHDIDASAAVIRRLEDEQRTLRAAAQSLRDYRGAIERTVTWQLRNRLIRVPGLPRLVRAITRASSKRRSTGAPI